jgi:hypothetical protein
MIPNAKQFHYLWTWWFKFKALFDLPVSNHVHNLQYEDGNTGAIKRVEESRKNRRVHTFFECTRSPLTDTSSQPVMPGKASPV